MVLMIVNITLLKNCIQQVLSSELLTQYMKMAIRTLDLSNLIPHLTKCRLLLRNGTDALTKLELTCQDCIIKFLLILKTKGQGWYIVIVAVS